MVSPCVPLGSFLGQSIRTGVKITCIAISIIIISIILFFFFFFFVTLSTPTKITIAFATSIAIHSAFGQEQCPWSSCPLFFLTASA